MSDSLKMDIFFPSELLKITSVEHSDSSVHIKMRSKTHSSRCPKCGEYSCAMKSQFRKNGNQMSGTGNHQVIYASLLA